MKMVISLELLRFQVLVKSELMQYADAVEDGSGWLERITSGTSP